MYACLVRLGNMQQPINESLTAFAMHGETFYRIGKICNNELELH